MNWSRLLIRTSFFFTKRLFLIESNKIAFFFYSSSFISMPVLFEYSLVIFAYFPKVPLFNMAMIHQYSRGNLLTRHPYLYDSRHQHTFAFQGSSPVNPHRTIWSGLSYRTVERLFVCNPTLLPFSISIDPPRGRMLTVKATHLLSPLFSKHTQFSTRR